MRAQKQPISSLPRMLRTPGQEPIVDKTGLTGKYDFTLEYTMDPSGGRPAGDADPPVAPAIFTALQEQLGLHLVAKKLPFDVVVVESFERMPTGNSTHHPPGPFSNLRAVTQTILTSDS